MNQPKGGGQFPGKGGQFKSEWGVNLNRNSQPIQFPSHLIPNDVPNSGWADGSGIPEPPGDFPKSEQFEKSQEVNIHPVSRCLLVLV